MSGQSPFGILRACFHHFPLTRSSRRSARKPPAARGLRIEPLERRELLAVGLSARAKAKVTKATADLQGFVCAATDTAQWGQAITVQSQIKKAGSGAVGAFGVQWYLSRDAVGSSDDLLLARTNGAGTSYAHAGIKASAGYGPKFTVQLQLPGAMPAGWAGQGFYIVMKTDAANQVRETNETNNFGQIGNGLDRDPITIGTAPAPPPTPSQPQVAFRFRNLDGANEGFNDPVYGASRQAAFQSALNIWSSVLVASYTGETITVDARMDPMGGSASGAILGSSGPNYIWRLNGPAGATWYADALANHLSGGDLNAAADITIVFNSDVDNSTVLGNTNWYYGLDGNCGNNIDFVTVVAHEVGHGLNILDLINTNGTWFASGTPGVYDRFLENAAGTDLTAMTDAQRASAIVSGGLYWNGAGGIQGNAGARPRMYAPSSYQSGSSVSHLDETVHRYELMSPYYSGPDHAPSAMELGMLRDMGWQIAGASSSLGGLSSSGSRLNVGQGFSLAGTARALDYEWSTYDLPARPPAGVTWDLSRPRDRDDRIATDEVLDPRVFLPDALLDTLAAGRGRGV